MGYCLENLSTGQHHANMDLCSHDLRLSQQLELVHYSQNPDRSSSLLDALYYYEEGL